MDWRSEAGLDFVELGRATQALTGALTQARMKLNRKSYTGLDWVGLKEGHKPELGWT